MTPSDRPNPAPLRGLYKARQKSCNGSARTSTRHHPPRRSLKRSPSDDQRRPPLKARLPRRYPPGASSRSPDHALPPRSAARSHRGQALLPDKLVSRWGVSVRPALPCIAPTLLLSLQPRGSLNTPANGANAGNSDVSMRTRSPPGRPDGPMPRVRRRESAAVECHDFGCGDMHTLPAADHWQAYGTAQVRPPSKAPSGDRPTHPMHRRWPRRVSARTDMSQPVNATSRSEDHDFGYNRVDTSEALPSKKGPLTCTFVCSGGRI